MGTLVLIIHLIVCLFLIVIVLIQGGKGAEMGAAFGGSSQTLFGARGAATVFSKLTTAAAVIFMITSFGLSLIATRGSSVVGGVKAPVQQPAQKNIPQGTGPIQEGQPLQPSKPVSPATPTAPTK
ncbi:MAG: preprotein translocase subunit SecG [Thermodesulfovibrionales bacterium]